MLSDATSDPSHLPETFSQTIDEADSRRQRGAAIASDCSLRSSPCTYYPICLPIRQGPSLLGCTSSSCAQVPGRND